MKKTLWFHILFWALFFARTIAYIVQMKEYGPNDFMAAAWYQAPTIPLFYWVALWLSPRFMPAKRYRWMIVGVLMSIGIVTLARMGARMAVVQFLHVAHYDQPVDITFFAENAWGGLVYSLIGLGYYYAQQSVVQEKRSRELEQAVASAQLAALKFQFSPHFLYNALNSLYSMALPLSDELAQSLLLISDMTRYAVEEGDEDGKTFLSKEVQYLEHFISLQRLRYKHNLALEFDLSGRVERQRVIPMLLISFVENAFKHGKFNKKAEPIIIKLHVGSNYLDFFIHNKKQKGRKDASSGIGLSNVRKRLELAYPNAHRLQIADEPDSYTVRLHLYF